MARELGISLGKFNHFTRAVLAKDFINFHTFYSNTDKRVYAHFLTSERVRDKSELARGFSRLKTQDY